MQTANRREAAPIEGAGYAALLQRTARIEERLDAGALDSTEELAPISAGEAATILDIHQEHRP